MYAKHLSTYIHMNTIIANTYTVIKIYMFLGA